jgi:endonuclease/exonuclease/phosphatase family metal-dependent hydrolase
VKPSATSSDNFFSANHRRRRCPLSLFIAGAAVVAAPGLATRASEPIELTVVSFNVLVNLGDTPGVPKWPDRKDLCAQVLADAKADLIGLQEPTPVQLKFFMEKLPDYEAVFYKGYPDATLLYRKSLFDERERGHWWLSPTPDRPTIGFGNALPRLVVWVRLTHKTSGRELYFFNTHFDNTMPSQVRMAELCQKQLAPLAANGLPMIFTGDFNTSQTRGDYPKLTSNGWKDSYAACDRATADGRDDNVATVIDAQHRIDHIFYHGSQLHPNEWRRLESPDPKKPLSDHYPILARFKLE